MIPIYRAKKLGSDEWVKGYYFNDIEYPDCHFITFSFSAEDIGIDINTLSIHFPNMLDKNGKEIFLDLDKFNDKLIKTLLE